MFTAIFDETLPGIGRVTIYDTGHATEIGRYVVCKTWKTGRRFRNSQLNYHQQPAAIEYAKRWLERQAEHAPLLA